MNLKTILFYKYRLSAVLIFILVGICILLTSRNFLSMHEDPPIYPGPGVTGTGRLSEYSEAVSGTAADTDIYFLEGSEEGGTILILGGTHPNEPAAFLTAVTLIENTIVNRGRIIVIPRANHSAFTATTPLEGYPQIYSIETDRGKRDFRFGGRATNPVHQWPDPLIYVNESGQPLTGTEVRNLNRSYPGNKNGYLTEQLADSIICLINDEKVDMAIDLHEASPEYPVINAIVAHENALDIAVETSMLLEFEDIEIGVERSPNNFHGLSHREWGDSTGVLAILMESANPAQGRLRGKTDSQLIVKGKDQYYVLAAENGLLSVPFTEQGHPIEERVGRHLEAFLMLIEVFSEKYPKKTILSSGTPGINSLRMEGLGAYLTPPADNIR
jgi:Succinylglutamate desuccinylase / Aspartoacylase family